MSGPASVPLAVAAFFVSNDAAKVALGATAFFCAWLAAYRVWKQEHVARLAAEARFDALANPRADWPIYELFSHIQPDLLDRPDEAAWDRIGNDLRDQFSMGNLKIWGRPVENGAGRLLGERSALQRIEPSYWRSAHFTFAFFDNTSGDAAHTYVGRNSGLPEYTDLLVNRAEALRIWPGIR
jgi:hypothetical protein